MFSPVLVDANVILDISTNDKQWFEWSAGALERAGDESTLVLNPIIYAEVSIAYKTIEALELALPPGAFRRETLPYEAAFLAGKAFLKYRQRGGRSKLRPLPDFYIGAHAAVAGYRLLTRDSARYRTYFPGLDVIAPG
jgi:predicted nucleic acid-binding protein